MQDKKTLLLYQEYREYFEMLDPKDCQDLLLAIFDYNVGKESTDLEGMARMAFAFMSNDIDRNNEKYQKRAQQSRENGKKGGRPPKEDDLEDEPSCEIETLENPAGYTETQKTQQVISKPRKPVKDKDKDKDKDKVNNKYKNIVQNADAFEPDLSRNSAINCDFYPDKDQKEQAKQAEQRHKDQQAKDLFEDLWQIYPVKRGKGNVSHTQKLRLAKIGMDEMVRAIERYKSDVESASFDLSYKNGSTFFNSGYVDYLDANYAPREKPQGKVVGQSAIATRYTASGGARDFSHLEE